MILTPQTLQNYYFSPLSLCQPSYPSRKLQSCKHPEIIIGSEIIILSISLQNLVDIQTFNSKQVSSSLLKTRKRKSFKRKLLKNIYYKTNKNFWKNWIDRVKTFNLITQKIFRCDSISTRHQHRSHTLYWVINSFWIEKAFWKRLLKTSFENVFWKRLLKTSFENIFWKHLFKMFVRELHLKNVFWKHIILPNTDKHLYAEIASIELLVLLNSKASSSRKF